MKAQTASLFYTHKGVQYMLNLIDTPVSIIMYFHLPFSRCETYLEIFVFVFRDTWISITKLHVH